MAVKLSALTTESAPASTDILAIADPTTGVMKKITVAALKTYMDTLGGGDVTAPTVTSATVENADPDTIVVVFSESVTGVSATGWSFKKNGSAWTISTVTGSGTTWNFNMASAAVNGDTLLRSYNSATGATVDGSSNELVTFTDSAVTNNVAAGVDYLAWTTLSASHEQITTNQGIRKKTGEGNAFGTSSNVSVSTETIGIGERVIWKAGAGANKSLGYFVGLGTSTATLMDSAPGLSFVNFVGYNLVADSREYSGGGLGSTILNTFGDDLYFCIFYDGSTIKYQTSTDAVAWTTRVTSANTPSGTYNVQFQPYSELGGPIQIWKA